METQHTVLESTPGKFDRVVECSASKNAAGVLLTVLMRRVKRVELMPLTRRAPSVLSGLTPKEAKKRLATMTDDEKLTIGIDFVAMCERVVCAAAIEPKFSLDGLAEGTLHIDDLADDDKVALCEVALEMSGWAALSQKAADLDSFRDEGEGGGQAGDEAGSAGADAAATEQPA